MIGKSKILKGTVVILALVIAAGILGYGQTVYLDCINGNTRTVVTVFGVPVSTTYTQTHFSKLVRDYHLEQNPSWEVVFEKNYGLVYFFKPASMSTSYHTLLGAMRDVPFLVESGYLDDPTTTIQALRALARSGNQGMSNAIINNITSTK